MDLRKVSDELTRILTEAQQEYEHKVGTLEERLRQAMLREQELKSENFRLTAEVERMGDHPDIKARKLREAVERRAAADREINALTDRGIRDLAEPAPAVMAGY